MLNIYHWCCSVSQLWFCSVDKPFEENRALCMDLVEIGIGITVMAAITSIFFDLAWGRSEKEEERQ